MKKCIDFLRVLIISPEFCVIAFVITGIIIKPEFLLTILAKTNLTSEIIKYFALVPVGLIVLILREVKFVLYPKEDKVNLLQKWPKYYLLKNRFYVSVLYGAVFVLLGLSTWVFTFNDKTIMVSLLFGSAIGSAIDYWTVYHAHIIVKEIFKDQIGV